MLAIASSTYTRVEIDTLIANISSSSNGSGYSNTQINTLLSDKQDNLLNASAQAGTKTYPLLFNNTIKQLRFDEPLIVSEEIDNRITVTAPNLYNKTEVDTIVATKQDTLTNATDNGDSNPLLLNNTIKQLRFETPLSVSETNDDHISIELLDSHIIYTSELVFRDVDNLSVDTLQIRSGPGGIQMIDKDNLSLMFFDEDHVTTYKPLVCNEDVTAPNLYNKTEVDTLIANIVTLLPGRYTNTQIDALFSTYYNQTEVDTLITNIVPSGSYTNTQIDTLFSTYYTQTEVDTLIANISSSSGYTNTQIDTLLSDKQDNLLNASAQSGLKTYPLLFNNTIKQLRFDEPLIVSEELDNRITVTAPDLYNKTEVDTIVATKQNLLNNGSDFSVDVGRGELYFENSSYDDANDGGGITLRVKDNPNGGSIFAVRSSGAACRLWVGQSITTPGDNDFYAGFDGATGAEGMPANYKHKMTSGNVTFGTDVMVNGSILSSIKNFLIPHPTKGGNWKLKHSCLESLGVPLFYKYSNREFSKGDNYIDLPEWYHKLVVPNTSFVMTQSHGHFGLSYGDIVNDKIKVTVNTAGVYHVILHAERDYDAGPDEFESIAATP